MRNHQSFLSYSEVVKKPILILTVVGSLILILSGALSAGWEKQFSYQTAQYRDQYYILRIPVYTKTASDTWITPYLNPIEPAKWHKTNTTQNGKHIFTTAGQNWNRILTLDRLLNESVVEQEARPIVAAWVVEQLALAPSDPKIVRDRLARATNTDREWIVSNEPEIQHLTINELDSYLKLCSEMD